MAPWQRELGRRDTDPSLTNRTQSKAGLVRIHREQMRQEKSGVHVWAERDITAIMTLHDTIMESFNWLFIGTVLVSLRASYNGGTNKLGVLVLLIQ